MRSHSPRRTLRDVVHSATTAWTDLMAKLTRRSLAQGDPLAGEQAVALAAPRPLALALAQAARGGERLGRICVGRQSSTVRAATRIPDIWGVLECGPLGKSRASGNTVLMYCAQFGGCRSAIDCCCNASPRMARRLDLSVTLRGDVTGGRVRVGANHHQKKHRPYHLLPSPTTEIHASLQPCTAAMDGIQ